MKPLQNLAADWPALEPLLDAALDLPAGQRAAWLAARNDLAPPLRDALARLIGLQPGVEAAHFLEALPATPADTSPGPQPGDRVGPYALLRPLGAGGMGVVWLADRVDGQLQRQVALKLPQRAWAPGIEERLTRERDILASLDHPHIARLYDAGFDDAGRPYLALEYIEGTPIDVHAQAARLDVDARLRLLLQVAQAVAHAHARRVVHRDLKPANILVTPDGSARLLDFGIAKLLAGEHTASTLLTRHAGQRLTPDYASPEQLRGEPLGPASDVYSLSVVAYELLTGVRPFAGSTGNARTPAALEQAVLADTPPLASRVAADPAVARRLRGDLDAILNMGLRKQPAQRHASVNDWARDLQHVLDGEPVSARPDTVLSRGTRFLRRHRAAAVAAVVVALAFSIGLGLGATTLVMLSLAAGLAAALGQAARAQRARLAAEAASRAAARATASAEAAASAERSAAAAARREAARAQVIGDFMVRVFRHNTNDRRDAEQARNRTARELLLQGVQEADMLRMADPQAHARLLKTFGGLLLGLRLYDDALAVLERAVTCAAAACGDDHGDTHVARLALAEILIGTPRGAEARTLVATALDGLRRHAPRSWDLARAWSMQASVLAQRDPAQAITAGRAAVALMSQQLTAPDNANGADTALAHQRLGRALMYADDPIGAADQHALAVDLLQRRLGADNILVVQARQDLAHALLLSGRGADAGTQWQQVLALVTTGAQANAEEAAEAHTGLARVGVASGDLVSARSALDAVQVLLEQDDGLRQGALRLVMLALDRADVDLAAGDAAFARQRAMAALARVPADAVGLALSLRVVAGRAAWLLGDVAAAEAECGPLLHLLPQRRGAGSVRLNALALVALCRAAVGDADAARHRLAEASAAIDGLTVALRRRFLLALAHARVDAVCGDAPALQQAADAWLPVLAASPPELPCAQRAELALLLVKADPAHRDVGNVLRPTLHWLRAHQVAHSPALAQAEALALQLQV